MGDIRSKGKERNEELSFSFFSFFFFFFFFFSFFFFFLYFFSSHSSSPSTSSLSLPPDQNPPNPPSQTGKSLHPKKRGLFFLSLSQARLFVVKSYFNSLEPSFNMSDQGTTLKKFHAIKSKPSEVRGPLLIHKMSLKSISFSFSFSFFFFSSSSFSFPAQSAVLAAYEEERKAVEEAMAEFVQLPSKKKTPVITEKSLQFFFSFIDSPTIINLAICRACGRRRSSQNSWRRWNLVRLRDRRPFMRSLSQRHSTSKTSL